MRAITRLLPLLLTGLATAGCVVQAPPGPPPAPFHAERHPAYLHALSDLRAARWMLEHRPGDIRVENLEDNAAGRIDQAIGEIKRAAIDDGKNLNDHPQADLPRDHRGRLHRAEDILHAARDGIALAEDNPDTRGLRDRALIHIDEAIRLTHRAIVLAHW